jgi:hypothetical protein
MSVVPVPRFIRVGATLLGVLGCALSAAEPAATRWHHEELRRFKAQEANQGVAVDADFFYAIDNRAIGKYRKDTGERVGGWEGEKGGDIQHLNAGVVLDGKLYCAHSNFPTLPEQSSVEIWDTATMQHEGGHHFENPPGSLTWVDRRDGAWFACFAHYQKTSDPTLTRVVKLDAQWRSQANWSFPAALIRRFAGNSSSGGAFGPGGHLFVTGHDARELYVLDLSESSGALPWRDTIPMSAAGQAFAWDRADDGVLYSIERKTREVIVSRIRTDAAEEDNDSAGFESLFDGQSLAGWEQKGNWVVEEGALFRKAKGGPLTYTAKKVPDDFELRFEWKVSKGCNSGVYYRPGQYEYQLLDNANSPYGENPRQSAAALYFCMAPAKDATKPFGEWNESSILCQGTVIQHWLNGEKVVDFDYTAPRWAKEVELLRQRGGDLAARGGQLWLQDHGAPVWFRHLRWRVISPTEKLTSLNLTPLPIPEAALQKEQERLQELKAKEKK